MSPILGIMASSTSGASALGNFESIATANGTGSSGTITFSGIPSTYTHLQLRFIGRGNSSIGGYPTDLSSFQLNSDNTSTNYYGHSLSGNGSAASATAINNNFNTYMPIPSALATPTQSYAIGVIDFIDYKNTNKYKTIKFLTGTDLNGSGIVRLASMLWKNTTAINSITIVLDPTYGGSWTTPSSLALYGIK